MEIQLDTLGWAGLPQQARPTAATPARKNEGDTDVVEGQADAETFDAVLQAFDLSTEGRPLLESVFELSDAERPTFLQLVAELLRSGVVGIETLEVNGEPYQSFVTTRLAAPELRNARLWRSEAAPPRALDCSA